MSEANEYEAAAALLEKLPALIRAKRSQEGLTLRQAQDRSGISLANINQVELGQRDPSTRLAAALLRWIGSEGKVPR